MIREPMSPQEFDAACRTLENDCPWLSLTSGARSPERNREVGGDPESKHLISMARDYEAPSHDERDQAMARAAQLGFWIKPYDWGLHVQGLPPGRPAEWWSNKYE